MSFLHQPYQYDGHVAVLMNQPVALDLAAPHSSLHPEPYMYLHSAVDLMESIPHTIMDYEEYAENVSRPRLTKEQVETLEAQFQVQPKPSSNVKRQLAAQINLSLPRVANWFQNRRAKAKQQKRQEEYERMQKANAQVEENAHKKPDVAKQPVESDKKIRVPSISKEEETSTTTMPTTTAAEQGGSNAVGCSSTSKHQKSDSETAREATFASLQRALNAATAAKESYTEDSASRAQSLPDVIEGSMASSPPCNPIPKPQSPGNLSYSRWIIPPAESSNAWSSSQSPDVMYTYNNLNGLASFTPTPNPVPVLDQSQNNSDKDDAYGTAHMHTHCPDWDHQLQKLRNPDAADSASIARQHSASLRAPSVTLSRQASSEALADSLGSFGIDATGGGIVNAPQVPRRVSDAVSPTGSGKELDLAARRKRPRPAAIGTSASSRAVGFLSMSPTTRVTNYGGANHAMRPSKSAQSLNSRYAGVRKVSAVQRSPLNFSTFAEAGSLGATKVEMLHPTVTTSALAPPTPLTPDGFQQFLPSPSLDVGYCSSGQPLTRLLVPSHPLQMKIESPPSTPLGTDVSPYQFQPLAPPMSAPVHYTTFPDYGACDNVPLTAKSWADTSPALSPTAVFNGCIQMPRPMHAAPINLEAAGDYVDNVTAPEPPSTIYSNKGAAFSTSSIPISSGTKPMEFYLHQFPEHQGAHRYVAQQLHAQTPKEYTFTNRTARDF